MNKIGRKDSKYNKIQFKLSINLSIHKSGEFVCYKFNNREGLFINFNPLDHRKTDELIYCCHKNL